MPTYYPLNPGDPENEHFLAATFRDVVLLIDSEFGEGYAKAHPELIGSVLASYVAWSRPFRGGGFPPEERGGEKGGPWR